MLTALRVGHYWPPTRQCNTRSSESSHRISSTGREQAVLREERDAMRIELPGRLNVRGMPRPFDADDLGPLDPLLQLERSRMIAVGGAAEDQGRHLDTIEETLRVRLRERLVHGNDAVERALVGEVGDHLGVVLNERGLARG